MSTAPLAAGAIPPGDVSVRAALVYADQKETSMQQLASASALENVCAVQCLIKM